MKAFLQSIGVKTHIGLLASIHLKQLQWMPTTLFTSQSVVEDNEDMPLPLHTARPPRVVTVKLLNHADTESEDLETIMSKSDGGLSIIIHKLDFDEHGKPENEGCV